MASRSPQFAFCRAVGLLAGVILLVPAMVALLLLPVAQAGYCAVTRQPADPWYPVVAWARIAALPARVAGWVETKA